MRPNSSVRLSPLLALLIAEIALLVAIRQLDWFATGPINQWIARLLAAFLPLLVAVALLVKRGLRFSLRTMLVATALIAVFLVITGVPLRNAIALRQVSHRLKSAGASIGTGRASEDFFRSLGYPESDPLPPSNTGSLPAWLRPLAGDFNELPLDEQVIAIAMRDDRQIAELCRDPAPLVHLKSIAVYRGVSPTGMESLGKAMPQFAAVKEVSVNHVPVTLQFLRALENVEFLTLSARYPRRFSYRMAVSAPGQLTTEYVAAIASLPHLKVLHLIDHGIADADFALLAKSASLEHVILNNATVSSAAVKKLRQQLPHCDIRKE